jgi:hypothetical protein
MKYIVAGFGKFGRLAVERIHAGEADSKFTVVDGFKEIPAKFGGAQINAVKQDAVSFLLESPLVEREDIILPMVPFNLAARYCMKALDKAATTTIPEEAEASAPNPFRLDASNLACSWADFLCPDDCPEGDLCTVTGDLRTTPLFEFLSEMKIPGFGVAVLRSRQILPGVGGYSVGDLWKLYGRIQPGRWIISTACKCHGIMTAVEAR